MTTPYHNHRGDKQAEDAFVTGAAWAVAVCAIGLAGIVLAGLLIYCWVRA